MKLTAFLLLVAFLHVHAVGYSQKVSLSVRNKSLQEIFPELTRQTGISIFYKEILMKETMPVSIQVNGASLTEVLDL